VSDSILARALRTGDATAMACEIDRLEDPDLPDGGGRTPLLLAALHGRPEGARRLLERGADPTRPSRTESGLDTPFLVALRQRDERSAALLLHAGRARCASRRPRNLTPAEEAALIADRTGAADAAAERLDQMLRSGLDPNACLLGHIALFSFYAIRRNTLAVSMLLQWGADRDEPIESFGDGRLSPLHVAADSSLDDVVWLLLLDGADPNRIDERRSPLFLAARSESPAVAEMLLDAGAEVDRGAGTQTPLMEAVQRGRHSTVELLARRGANVNATSASGWSPLHYAAKSDQIEIAKRLLDLGADPLHVSEDGENATDLAARYFDPIYAQIYRDWGIPDRYSVVELDDTWEPDGDFDVFISYRHGKFASVADELARTLKSLDARPFVDRAFLGGLEADDLSDAALKSRLAKAVRRSRLLAFFESYLDPDGSASRAGISWQFFELLHARSAFLISMTAGTGKRWVTTPGKRVSANDLVFTFEGVEDLAAKLLRQMQ
jgi:ankyrin repeat protein